MDRQDAAYHLNDLVQINLDAYEGFLHAADDLDRASYADMFREAAGERRQFADRLQTMVISFGQVPDRNSTLGAAIHRTWMDIRQAISSNDETAILSEVERSERAALDTYDHVLEQQPLPDEMRETVREQYLAIRRFYERVRDLREVLEQQNR